MRVLEGSVEMARTALLNESRRPSTLAGSTGFRPLRHTTRHGNEGKSKMPARFMTNPDVCQKRRGGQLRRRPRPDGLAWVFLPSASIFGWGNAGVRVRAGGFDSSGSFGRYVDCRAHSRKVSLPKQAERTAAKGVQSWKTSMRESIPFATVGAMHGF